MIQQIREYRIISEIGKGGMGAVYLAEDENIGRKVAIKALLPSLTTEDGFIERFKQEARIQGSLIHQNIATLHSFFQEAGQLFMVMEYIEGVDLRRMLKQKGVLPEPEALTIMDQILEALSYAHSMGVVHRDISPSNIMIKNDGIAKVMDFGIAKVLGNSSQTRTGTRMGKLYYMSPEQVLASKDIDQRSDIFTLGIMLYEMLTGVLPYTRNTDSDYMVMDEILKKELQIPKNAANVISERTKTVILKMTAKNRDVRFETCLRAQRAFKTTQNNASANPNMVFVEGGTFRMGSNDLHDNEKPIHPVTVKSFNIGKYQVTQKEWQEVMGNNPSYFKGDNLPVEMVSWYDAVEFCNKKSRKKGLTPVYSGSGDNITVNWSANGYRLPTEAEWEYAARGGIQSVRRNEQITLFPEVELGYESHGRNKRENKENQTMLFPETEWEYAKRGGNISKGYTYSGSDNIDEVAWHCGNSEKKTHPVGTRQSNVLGIYDMSGNVWEWCWDWYGGEYYSNSPSTNPTGPTTGKGRVLRGGSWSGFLPEVCRVADQTTPEDTHSSSAFLPEVCRVADRYWDISGSSGRGLRLLQCGI